MPPRTPSKEDFERMTKHLEDISADVKLHPEKARELLVRAGIMNSDGTLTEPYRSDATDLVEENRAECPEKVDIHRQLQKKWTGAYHKYKAARVWEDNPKEIVKLFREQQELKKERIR